MGRSVDTHDPEATEIPLFVTAIAVRIPPSTLDRFLGRTPQLAARAEVAAGGLHDLLLAR